MIYEPVKLWPRARWGHATITIFCLRAKIMTMYNYAHEEPVIFVHLRFIRPAYNRLPLLTSAAGKAILSR